MAGGEELSNDRPADLAGGTEDSDVHDSSDLLTR